MAQQLRALTALPENPGSIPSTHMAAHNCSRGLDILIQTYMQAKYQLFLKVCKHPPLVLIH